MANGRRGLILKWAAGIGCMLVIGCGNVLGIMVQKIMYAQGMIMENAQLLRWCMTGGIWLLGVIICALAYALGAALERIDGMEMWLCSLDTAVRNRQQEQG